MIANWCRFWPVVPSLVLAIPAIADEAPETLVVRAEQALSRGDTRDALQPLERLRFQGQLTDSLRLQLAQGYLRLRRLEEARQEAALVDPDIGGVDLLLLWAKLAVLGEDWLAARDRYLEVLALTPSIAGAYLGLGQALQELGDTEGADAAFAGYVQYSR